MKPHLGVSFLAWSALACGSTGSTPAADGGGDSCTTAATGTLSINVAGLPAGVNASVKIVGPGGEQTVTAGTQLASAKSGDYAFTAATVAEADPIVRKAYEGTVSVATAKLCDGKAISADVTYSLIASSNKVWWGSSNSSSNTLGYASAALAATGSPEASVAAKTKGNLPGAFDGSGNLWVIDGTDVGIKRYAAETLGASGDKTPDVVLSSDALTGGVPGPVSLAFDASGNLWIGVLYSKKIIELEAAQLAATATVTPKVEISNVAGPKALAFDVKGNLWVGSDDHVLEYAVSRLAASTSAAPDISIAGQTPLPVVGPLPQVLGLAFTPTNELWVNFDGTLAKLTSIDLGSSQTLTPAIQIKADVLALPEGIAFDEGGGLWIAYSAGKFCKFGAGQLTASGTVAPEVIVSSASVGSATSPALYPAPAALPMYSALK